MRSIQLLSLAIFLLFTLLVPGLLSVAVSDDRDDTTLDTPSQVKQSQADLKALCTDAAMGPIRQLGPSALEIDVQDVPPISFKHFRQSLRGMKPSVAPADLVQYEEWDKVYGSKRATDDASLDASSGDEDAFARAIALRDAVRSAMLDACGEPDLADRPVLRELGEAIARLEVDKTGSSDADG